MKFSQFPTHASMNINVGRSYRGSITSISRLPSSPSHCHVTTASMNSVFHTVRYTQRISKIFLFLVLFSGMKLSAHLARLFLSSLSISSTITREKMTQTLERVSVLVLEENSSCSTKSQNRDYCIKFVLNGNFSSAANYNNL